MLERYFVVFTSFPVNPEQDTITCQCEGHQDINCEMILSKPKHLVSASVTYKQPYGLYS